MYDVVSDIHNCYDEFYTLLVKLGYTGGSPLNPVVGHPTSPSIVAGRKLIIAGDWIDRGPKPVETLKLIMQMHKQGFCIPVKGGHEQALVNRIKASPDSSKWVIENNPHYTQSTLEALQQEGPEFIDTVRKFIDNRPPIFVAGDKSETVFTAVHAAWKPWNSTLTTEGMISTYLDGSPTGWSVDEEWKQEIYPKYVVVSGHRNMLQPKTIVNSQGGKSIAIDTGCSYGNMLTAYKYPENTFVSVKALKEHYHNRWGWWK